jgi:N-sulfoglucosamine sulfohydrolase
MKQLLTIALGLIAGLASAAPPHVVVFLADDLGRLDTAVYGSKHVRTPNLERLSASGMTFERAFIASPACAPSRAALLTGLMPARNGAEANHTYPKPGTKFLSASLKGLGYEIASFGKIAHGVDRPEYGFDHFSRPPVDLAQHVAEYFEQRDSEAPLLLMVGDRRPHVPWTSENIYDPREVDLPPYFIDTPETREHRARYYSDITGLDEELGKVMKMAREKLGDNIVFVFSSDHGGQWPFGKWNLYDAGINVPLIVAWDGKIKPNTRTKAMVSWVDVIPTLIELAGQKPPSGIDGRSFADVLTGKRQEHRAEIFTTHSGDGVYNVYPIRSIRTERFKYIRNLLPDHIHSNHSDILRKDGAGAYWDSWDQAAQSDPHAAEIIEHYFVRPAEELYDLSNDALEQNNLAANSEHAQTLQELSGRLDRWMQQQGDQQTVFNTPYAASAPRPNAETIQRK